MDLNGTEGYFTIEHYDARIILKSNGLDGSAFMINNWKGLERLTLNGRELKRVTGMPGSFCVYEEVTQQPTQKQP